MMMKRVLQIAAVLGLVFAGPIARADIVDPSLADLISTGGSITVGDKVFSQFSYTGNSTAPTSANLFVGPIPPNGTDAFGNFGLQFAGGASSPVTGGTTDFTIGYTVTNLGTTPLITDVHLTSNLSIAGTPQTGAGGTIVETINAANVGVVAQINNSVTATSSSLDSQASFNPAGPYQSLRVTKDVQLVGTDVAFANVSFIDQSFSQVVPEPSSLLLMGLGGLGLMGYSWRRRQRVS